MATSGSTDWKLDGTALCSAILRKSGCISRLQEADSNDQAIVLVAMNGWLKSLALDGVSLWLVQEAVLHLEKDEDLYTLGASGDNFCAASDAVTTTLATAAAATATALTVVSNTGIVNSDKVGVELDDGTLFWSTQSGAPSGTTDLTLASGITSAASSGNRVFAYTTKLTQPTEISEARIRDTDNHDVPLVKASSMEEFQNSIDNKSDSGEATDFFFLPQMTNGNFYIYPTADDVTQRVFMTIRRVIEDFDAVANDADFPPQVTEAIVWNVAVRVAPEYGREPTPFMVQMAADSYRIIKNAYGKKADMQLRPFKRPRRR